MQKLPPLEGPAGGGWDRSISEVSLFVHIIVSYNCPNPPTVLFNRNCILYLIITCLNQECRYLIGYTFIFFTSI